MRCVYLDLDGTLLGPGASLFRGADGQWSSLGARALEACWRTGAEVVLYSGRRQPSVSEGARLIGSSSYIFELGCGLVLDGELEWLTDGIEPSDSKGTIFDQIEASGAPGLLLERYLGRLEYHTPWSSRREVSHLFRGSVDLEEVAGALEEAGFGWLRLVDNGIVREHAEQMPGVSVVRAYHLVPAAASKARGVARHMQARGYAPDDCIAVGDSREDLDVAGVVGTFWLVANAIERDPELARAALGGSSTSVGAGGGTGAGSGVGVTGATSGLRVTNARGAVRRNPGAVRVASEAYGAGVYEAVVTTLAGG